MNNTIEQSNYKIYEELSRISSQKNLKEFIDFTNNNIKDIHISDERGWTIAMIVSYFDFHHAISFLNKLNVDFTKKEKNGATALHLALALGNEKTVSELLKTNKVNINEPNLSGLTPVMEACSQESPIFLKMLMPFKPNFYIRDKYNKNALDYAQETKNNYAQSIIEQQIFNEKIVLNHKLENKKISKI